MVLQLEKIKGKGSQHAAVAHLIYHPVIPIAVKKAGAHCRGYCSLPSLLLWIFAP